MTTSTAPETTLAKLQKEAAELDSAAAAAAAQAEATKRRAAQLRVLVDALPAAMTSYVHDRATAEPGIKDLKSRYASIAKNLKCKLTDGCVTALDEAFGAYPGYHDAKQSAKDGFEVCDDADSIPGHEAKCKAKQNDYDKLHDRVAITLNEGANLGSRVEKLKADAEAIESIVCAHDGDCVKAYAQYLHAKWALDHIYQDVDPTATDAGDALATLVSNLTQELAEKAQALADCTTELNMLKGDRDTVAAELENLEKDGGLQWMIKRAAVACAPAAPPAAGATAA